jgi:hypothetical protein
MFLASPKNNRRSSGMKKIIYSEIVDIKSMCPECDGVGGAPAECPYCNGYGVNYTDRFGIRHPGEKCPYCSTVDGDTTGIAWKMCEKCDGEGFIIENKLHNYPEIFIKEISKGRNEIKAFLKTFYEARYPHAEDISVSVVIGDG